MNNQLNITSLYTSNNMTSNIYERISNSYRPLHGWMAVLVCLFGIPCNLLNVIVLTRQNMISSPTNVILTGLAFSDLLTMLSYLPYSVYFYILFVDFKILEEVPARDSLFWVHYNMFHTMITVTCHGISIWLTVYLACFRYFYLISASPTCIVNTSNKKNKNNENISNLKVNTIRSNLMQVFQRCLLQCRTYKFNLYSILGVCLFCFTFCIPAYMWPRVVEKEKIKEIISNEGNTSFNEANLTNKTVLLKIKYFALTNRNVTNHELIYNLMYYSQAIFAKFIPCILLLTFSSLLIHSLIIINRNNKKLNQSNKISS